MIPSGPVCLRGRRASIRLALLAAAMLLCNIAPAAHGADQQSRTPAAVDPRARSQTTDHYVGGKYDKTGIYIPPHYQAVSKPRFHGYFFNKHEGGDKAQKPN